MEKEEKQREKQFYTLEEWKEIIERWRESGLSKTTYCKREGLTPSAFRRWFERVSSLTSVCEKKAKIKKEGQDAFIPLHLSSGFGVIDPLSGYPKLDVFLANGHRLSLQGAMKWESVLLSLKPLLMK